MKKPVTSNQQPVTSNQQPVTKLGEKELRKSRPSRTVLGKIKRREIYIICDNILDTYNIGSIFRVADAVSAQKIFLCGSTETPPNSRISKAAVGTDKWVPWEYASSAAEAIANLKKKFSTRSNNNNLRAKSRSSSIKIIAIEQNPKSVDFREIEYKQSFSSNKKPVAFVIGHETSGVSEEALKMCDQVVEIPMFGVNRSLNVMVSLAIVLFKVI